MGWGDPQDKKNYIPLPFYEYEWLRKDIQKVEPGRAYPMVGVLISGITGTILNEANAAFVLLGMMLLSSTMALLAALFVLWLDRCEAAANPA